MKGASLRRSARSHVLWHVTFTAAAIVVIWLLLRELSAVLLPVVLAAAVAYLVEPLVLRVMRLGVRRGVAAAVVLVGFAVVTLAVLAVLLPLITRDIAEFAPRVPDLVERASARLEELFGLRVSDWREIGERLRASLSNAAAEAGATIVQRAAQALGGLVSFIGALVELLLIPLFAFYFSADWPRHVERMAGLIPPRQRERVLEVVREIDARLSHWVRGQLTVMVVLAVLYAIALTIVGIPLAIPIGVLAGLLSVIPYVGNFFGLGLALVMGLLEWEGMGRLLAIGGVFAVMNVVEGFVLVPALVGKSVGLSEASALFAVLAGGHLLGFLGLMVAIPVAAAVTVLVQHATRAYQESAFYREGGVGEVGVEDGSG